MHAFGCGKEIQQGNGRRGHIAHHDAGNQQHDAATYQRGKKKNHPHDQHGTGESTGHHCQKAGKRKSAGRHHSASDQHDQGHPEACPRTDTQNRRVGQRVIEHRLQHQARGGQGGPTAPGRHAQRHAGFPHDERPGFVFHRPTRQRAPDRSGRNVHRTEQQVSRRQHKNDDDQYSSAHISFTLHRNHLFQSANLRKYLPPSAFATSGWNIFIKSSSNHSGWKGVSS